MDSYISCAKIEKKNKSLIHNLNNLQISYKKLLEFSSTQETKFSELIENTNNNYIQQKNSIILENETKLKELIELYNKKLDEKENELLEKVSTKEIEEKNQEIEIAYQKIRDLEDERKYLIKLS